MKNRAVITVLGADKVGIVAAITAVLARHQVNIQDIRMVVMGDLFTMIAMVDLAGLDVTFLVLKQDLEQVGLEMGVQVLTQREEVFGFMHRV